MACSADFVQFIVDQCSGAGEIAVKKDFIWHYDSPLGGITLGSDGSSLIGLWFDGQMHFSDVLLPKHEEKPIPVFIDTCRWLDIYFSGNEPDFTPPLVMRASPFRKAVWEIMLTIPYGKTMTYGEIAKRIAERKGVARMAAQAVGGAVGHNSISLIVPCHRVIGADGSLTGYAGGIDKKVNLLRMEGAMIKCIADVSGSGILSAERDG